MHTIEDMTRYLMGGVVVLLIAAAGAFFFTYHLTPGDTGAAAISAVAPALTPEVEAVIARYAARLSEIVDDPLVQSATMAANTEHARLSESDIKKADDAWQGAGENDVFIAGIIANNVSVRLREFAGRHTAFKEVFIADSYGLNVGQTDRTSDYYQADEAWWQNGYNKGVGKVGHGAIEFDTSAQSESIAIYVPVMREGRAIGVIKAILDLSAIKAEL